MASIHDGIRLLSDAGIESARLDAQLLLAHVVGQSREDIIMHPPTLTAHQHSIFGALVARRAAREPMSHITGVREFYGRSFIVTADVLDPRPDSECLIEAALAAIPDLSAPLRLLDLGTGSGCLLLTLLAELPHATGVAVDISPAALHVTKRNAEALGLTQRVRFECVDMGEFTSDAQFDVIVSNPPYIPHADIATLAPEVAHYEPKLALDGGISGLDCYAKLAKQLPHLLAPRGFAVLEIGSTQADDVCSLLQVYTLQCTTTKDLNGLDRTITVTTSTAG